MKQAQCGEGTVITIGHPANKILAVKGETPDGKGFWRYIHNGELVDEEDAFRGMWDLYTPTHKAPVVEGSLVERDAPAEFRVVRGSLVGPAEPGVMVIEDERPF